MEINPHYCRHSIMDAAMIPLLHKNGTWKPQLLAVCVCLHPNRQKYQPAALSQNLPGVLCDATVDGKCELCEDVVLHDRK